MIWPTSSKLFQGPKFQSPISIKYLALNYAIYPLLKYSNSLAPPWIMTLNLSELLLVLNSEGFCKQIEAEDERNQLQQWERRAQEVTLAEPGKGISSADITAVLRCLNSSPLSGSTGRYACGSWEEMAQNEMDGLEELRLRIVTEMGSSFRRCLLSYIQEVQSWR